MKFFFGSKKVVNIYQMVSGRVLSVSKNIRNEEQSVFLQKILPTSGTRYMAKGGTSTAKTGLNRRFKRETTNYGFFLPRHIDT